MFKSGWVCWLTRIVRSKVADVAGGFPVVGEGFAGVVAAEAEDEAVHGFQGVGDFAEEGAEGGGEGFAGGDAAGRAFDDGLVIAELFLVGGEIRGGDTEGCEADGIILKGGG